MASGRYPRITVTEDAQPSNIPFQLGVEKIRDFSPDAPARIRGSFENRASEEQTVSFGAIQPYSSIWSEDEGWLVLIPSKREIQEHVFGTDEEIIPDHPVEGCWQANLVHFVLPDVLRWQTLDPGECIQSEYTVLHYPEREILDATMDKWVSTWSTDTGCLPAGKHRFAEHLCQRLERTRRGSSSGITHSRLKNSSSSLSNPYHLLLCIFSMVTNKNGLEAVDWLIGKEIISAFLVVVALVGAATLIQIQAVQIPGYIIMLGSDLIQNPYLPGLTGLAYDIFFVVYLYGVAVLLGNLYRFVRPRFQ